MPTATPQIRHALQCTHMRGWDLSQVKRDILMGPIGMGASVMSAYLLLCALFTASCVHALFEDGKHFLNARRVESQPVTLLVLCHEKLGRHSLPAANFIPELAHVYRVIGWLPLRSKSAWPGPSAVARAP
jgi:hypothetical protein